jgi:hypothetical protein
VSRRRVLVATQGRCPAVALEHAAAFAGPGGEVVLASVLVVPHAQPIDASLDRSVADACAVLDAAERSVRDTTVFDTRLLRARSFAEAVLDAMAAERFDVLILELGGGGMRNGMRAQVEALMERADATVVLVRPREAVQES